MGYRSDVYIKVHKNDEDKLTDVLRENDFEPIKEYEDGDYAGYALYDVKWYGTFREVKAVNDFIAEESEHPRGSIALGEDGAKEDFGLPWEVGLCLVTQVIWS